MSSPEALARWQATVGNNGQQSAPKPESDQPQAGRPGAPAALPAVNGALEWRKKTVLLVDSNLRSRESRAKVMRNKGVHVDCVANADAARVRLGAEKYNLILVDLGRDTEAAESLVREIRSNNSRQLVGFLVGSPWFVAKSLTGGKGGIRKPSPIVAPVEVENKPRESASENASPGP